MPILSGEPIDRALYGAVPVLPPTTANPPLFTPEERAQLAADISAAIETGNQAEEAAADAGATYPDTASIYTKTVDSEGEETGAETLAGTTPIRIEKASDPRTVVEAGRMVERTVFTACAPITSESLLRPENELVVGSARYYIVDTDYGVSDPEEVKIWLIRLR